MQIQVNAPWGTNAGLDYQTLPYRIRRSTGEIIGTTSVSARNVQRTRSLLGSGAFDGVWRSATSYKCTVFLGTREPGQTGDALDNWKHWSATGSYKSSYTLASANAEAALPNLRNASATGALNKLNDEKMQLGVNLLETRKTIRTVADLGTKVFKIYHNLRRGDFGAVAEALGLRLTQRATRNLAKEWLEYQYAWLPVYRDLHAAYDIAQQGLEKDLEMRVSREVKGQVDGYLGTWEPEDYNSTTRITQFYTRVIPVELGVKTIIYAKVDGVQLASLKQFGLANPLSIAWELVPWSFVVDWVLPVGEFLNACTATFGLTFKDGCRVETAKVKASLPTVGGSADWLKIYEPYLTVGSVSVESFDLSRIKLTAFPQPVLYGKSVFSNTKVVTAAALWRTVRKR